MRTIYGNHILYTKLLSNRRRKRNEGTIEESQTRGERSSCTNITNTQDMYQYHHYHLPLRTHTQHTRIVCLATIFLELGGTQSETLYGIHISTATNIYLYIQHAIYIYMTIQPRRETIASFPLSL